MCKAIVNEDANAKLIRELKEEIQKLRELLKNEGIEVKEGKQSETISYLFFHTFTAIQSFYDLLVFCYDRECWELINLAAKLHFSPSQYQKKFHLNIPRLG